MTNRKIFWEKVKLKKFSSEFEKFVGNNGENLKQGGKCIIASEGWTPLIRSKKIRFIAYLIYDWALTHVHRCRAVRRRHGVCGNAPVNFGRRRRRRRSKQFGGEFFQRFPNKFHSILKIF